MIEIRTFFDGWVKVDKEHATSYARKIWQKATAIKEEERVDYINKRVRGISFTREDFIND